MSCMVRNISAEGAAIDVENPAFVPARFRLVMANDSSVRECRIAWIQKNRIGLTLRRARAASQNGSEAPQRFSSGLIFSSSSSNDIAPLSLSPLTKKVGVASTFSSLVGEFLIGGQLVEQRLILHAGLDRLFVHAELLADRASGSPWYAPSAVPAA